ncbi:sensor histidine kinase [Brevibacterium luteolum]|uniref:sensor histidine kinase n=1 Tax=Brevibacterium luteolum TaxID=199591 RepID=UPI00223C4485|nr:HAMP domain-containing sensor histidine kinase [Brevibacterium luteolum]MCT1655977.1 HAMP domain-containing histidine kinase [Brevibacterium luteolum]MCT1872471.1 HAMP domain-containing histidine kinase [Brevibacterium luteolum]MCT1890211.1 HAMP domain-containing histidine kinase [Brevibacterium luteolum]MCT1892731.1 HAMP domain-containing histidine kinase [Brevibacterium luteolum]MCT1920568.1 HAMP domain-containing histidine kinase [Brevibacterium luteolum]
MNQFLIFEIRIWLLLILVLLLLGLLAGAFFYLRHLLRKREAALRAEERARAEHEALANRNRMLIRLDHELKNPLTALRTSAATIRELVTEPVASSSEIEPVARQIDTSSRRVARLLADLRKLADIESREIHYQRVNMDQLIHQAVEDARTAPGAEDRMIIATVARAPWRLPDVAGEEDLLMSAIMNLLGNAIKYSTDTDVIELRANEQVINQHRWIVIEVADTGMGIPAAEQATVWDELSRGQQVRAVAGSGMGLSLVRSIISRHGGSVSLLSQEGQGTSVRLVLPVLGEAQQPVAPQDYDGAAAVAGSRPVEPVNANKAGRADQSFRPPRAPSEAELGRMLGTPRRGSKRRLQKVDGQWHDTATGETLGNNGQQQPMSGSQPGPYGPPPQQGMPPQQPGGQRSPFAPPRPAQQPVGSQPVGSPPPQAHAPQQPQSGQQPQQPQTGPGPQQHGSGSPQPPAH